jgi:hypothetical protein
MPDAPIEIEIKGLDDLLKHIDKAPYEIQKAISLAGSETYCVPVASRTTHPPPLPTDRPRPTTSGEEERKHQQGITCSTANGWAPGGMLEASARGSW